MGFFTGTKEALGIKGPDTAKFDREISKEQNEQAKRIAKQAEKIRLGREDLTRDRFNIQADPMRMELGDQIDDIRRGASSRGLLYSGLRSGAESEARGQLASNLARTMAQANRDQLTLEDEGDVAATGSLLAARQSEMENYNQSIANAMRANQLKQQARSGPLGLLTGFFS